MERPQAVEATRLEAGSAALGVVETIPDFLTVEEAARVLRIGRTSAYALAALFEETDGAEGLPVVRYGRLLRVPRAALEAQRGAITHIPPPRRRPAPTPAPSIPAPSTDPVDTEQLTFPPTAA